MIAFRSLCGGITPKRSRLSLKASLRLSGDKLKALVALASERNWLVTTPLGVIDRCILRRLTTDEATMPDVNTRETGSLIGSDKVEGTAVYGSDRNKIGSVQRVMIDKISGKVAYAVISFGGFLGMGEDYYPVPWATLKYDTGLGGYLTGLTEASLKGAPKYSRTSDWDWNRDNDRRVSEYYKTDPFWS